MRHFAFTIAVLVGLNGPAFGENSDHVSKIDGLRAVHAWTRATETDETLVFVEIENESADAVMLEGAAADGPSAELVGFRLVDGEPRYEAVGAVPIPPGRTLHLEPDGLALRLTGLSAPMSEGDELELDLITSIGTLEMHVEVEAADAKAHSHAGHSH